MESVADDQIGFPCQQGGKQGGDPCRVVLAIGIQLNKEFIPTAQGKFISGLQGTAIA
ncbi:MAG: hypothetical protein OZSIB_0660 [Candidatus Ozemobacter sibiricus]|uniref:Uncharacterized protein n=1 Tax=Candidatus Ozemobacter sibiricus TaxID=2268124 RepID=A0A367ZTZ4_9BACT|nr:MAG: hypothetical protein OZSIB_0660 [Candidatus Ozemobacter sibiricus]